MWSRKRIDIGWLDLIFGISRVFVPPKSVNLDELFQGTGSTTDHLTKKGYDATQGHSLCVVKLSKDDFTMTSKISEELLSKIVFLPFYPEMPDHEAHAWPKKC